MRGVLLDSRGRPVGASTLDQAKHAALALRDPAERRGMDRIIADLEASARHSGPFEPRASMQSWRETLYATQADGTAITAAAETIMVPDFSLPANYLYPGRVLEYTLFGRQSTAITTPGTITLRLRYGGVAGTVIAASGAFAPDSTAAATNLTVMVQWTVMCRSIGTAGTVIGFGQIEWSDYDDASAAALVGNLNMRMAPTSAPATATVNTTTANALSPTYTSSVATASFTCHLAILEALT